MRPSTKISLVDEAGDRFFGEGPWRLLREVERTGSLRAAAQSMGMAYSKATRLLHRAETVLGFPLTVRTVGGRDGGGSTLTPRGRQWLQQYEAYREACIRESEARFREFFPRTGCVIMASGLGKRFGGNKLMAPFGEEPLIAAILHTTQGLFDSRVVVTRHPEVADYCRQRQIPAVLHSLPHRSDTVRLGLEAVGDVQCCLFCPGDQPLLRRQTLEEMLLQWHRSRACILRPCFRGTPGAPVLFPREFFGELMALPEGRGGNAVLERHPHRVQLVEAAAEAELLDADTPEELLRLQKLWEGESL